MSTDLVASLLNEPQVSPTPSHFRSAEVKSPAAFRTISEVATDLDVPQHVLRFWESKFQQIRPLKRGGGRRYYRPEDVDLISGIKDLLYNQGFTIRGVQKLLKENGRLGTMRSVLTASQGQVSTPPVAKALPLPGARGLSLDKRREIESVLEELKTLRELMRKQGIV